MSGSDDLHPAASFDGGDLDCGNGLLLLIRKHIDPLAPGDVLEIRSRERSVGEDLPAWCRLTGNAFVGRDDGPAETRYWVQKRQAENSPPPMPPAALANVSPSRSSPVAVLDLPPLAVMGIGSWPRPPWLLHALHEFVSGRMPEEQFQATADDAVRLALDAQLRAGVDVVVDGEQRRDGYASFVGQRLENCQLVPLVDLLPYVDDPDKFAAELKQLDVPADKVRHPAVFGKIARKQALAVHEVDFVRSICERPVKVALPGPYLLVRTMWLECVSDRVYDAREQLADDVVQALREEAAALLGAGAAIVQFDEPVLTEVVHGRAASGNRSFMCGALGERLPAVQELAFAEELLKRVCADLPAERLALHVCRGNWSTDEAKALAGDYRPLLGLLSGVPVKTLFLELCTPRAGEIEALADLPRDKRVGVGVLNQKSPTVDQVEAVASRARRAIDLFGFERVWLNADCGFATFSDSPMVSAAGAQQRLATIVAASKKVREERSV